MDQFARRRFVEWMDRLELNRAPVLIASEQEAVSIPEALSIETDLDLAEHVSENVESILGGIRRLQEFQASLP